MGALGKVAAGALVPVLMVMALIAGGRSETPPRCMDAEMRELVRALMLDGIDLAFKDHTKHLFDIWMKDASEQPTRAAAGMNNGVNAYVRARTAALKWSPPLCAAKPKG